MDDIFKWTQLSCSKCDRWSLDSDYSEEKPIKIRSHTVNSINDRLHCKRRIVSFSILSFNGNENMHRRDLIQNRTIFGFWLNSTWDMSSYHIHIHFIKISLSIQCYVISCAKAERRNRSTNPDNKTTESRDLKSEHENWLCAMLYALSSGSREQTLKISLITSVFNENNSILICAQPDASQWYGIGSGIGINISFHSS